MWQNWAVLLFKQRPVCHALAKVNTYVRRRLWANPKITLVKLLLQHRLSAGLVALALRDPSTGIVKISEKAAKSSHAYSWCNSILRKRQHQGRAAIPLVRLGRQFGVLILGRQRNSLAQPSLRQFQKPHSICLRLGRLCHFEAVGRIFSTITVSQHDTLPRPPVMPAYNIFYHL